MALRPCLDCKEPTAGTRCPTCTRAKDKARGTTASRGYDHKHRRRSEKERAQVDGQACHLCGKPMYAWQQLALDHTPDRTGYRGVTHFGCNSAEPASRRISPDAYPPG